MPRLCKFYPGVCLTTEEKARKNLSQGKKNLSQVKKKLSQNTIYVLSKNHTLQNPHITTKQYKTTKYKLKQTQCKIYPNEVVTV
jgi:hypothetical protein